jgi:hypothetical protein
MRGYTEALAGAVRPARTLGLVVYADDALFSEQRYRPGTRLGKEQGLGAAASD